MGDRGKRNILTAIVEGLEKVRLLPTENQVFMVLSVSLLDTLNLHPSSFLRTPTLRSLTLRLDLLRNPAHKADRPRRG